MKLNLLVISAHPDDAEMSCGGTIAKHTSKGYKVGLVDMTMGELGTRGTPELRLQEAENARQILGAEVRENLGMADGFFRHDKTHVMMIIEKIRQYQPDMIITNSPEDRHPDHPRASAIVKEAAFLSGLRNIHTTLEGKVQSPWRPENLFHYIQHFNHTPDFIVDISGFLERKMEAIKAFKSQFHQPDSDEPDTVLSQPGFLESLKSRSLQHGGEIFKEAGEGLLKSRMPGIDDLNDIK